MPKGEEFSLDYEASVTLTEAVRRNRLYVCDYAALAGATSDILMGEQRYIAVPIALFYWNTTSPAGHPHAFQYAFISNHLLLKS